MFDPDANAAYAARFLSELHAELGDWSRAAGAYHSRTPSFAWKYRARFDRIRARLVAAHGEDAPTETVATVAAAEPALAARQTLPPPAAADTAADEIRDNRFPLLLSTGSDRGLASLVPLEIAVTARLIDGEARRASE
jgi:soluble lytic murein transglycosylase-like protein